MQRYVYLGQQETAEVRPGLTPNENAAHTLGAAPLSLEGRTPTGSAASRCSVPDWISPT